MFADRNWISSVERNLFQSVMHVLWIKERSNYMFHRFTLSRRLVKIISEGYIFIFTFVSVSDNAVCPFQGGCLLGLQCFTVSLARMKCLLMRNEFMNLRFVLDEKKHSECATQDGVKINHNEIPQRAGTLTL